MRAEVDKPLYDMFKVQFTGKTGYIFGTYAGYSGVVYRPMMDVLMIAPNGELPCDMAVYKTGTVANKTLADAVAAEQATQAQAQNSAPQAGQADQNKSTQATGNGNTSSGNDEKIKSVIAPNTYSTIEEVKNTSDKYVLNIDTKKIHYRTCEDIDKMSPENARTTSASIADIQAADPEYTTCGHCNPQ